MLEAPAPFIVGVPRSGTTLLRFMLDAHPDLAIPPETGFVPHVARLRGSGWRLRRRVLRTITSHPADAPAWPDFALDSGAFGRELDGLRPFFKSAALRAFYRSYAARFDKVRWGDKTPLYGLEMRSIRSVLPEARFIHIIRDGRAVVSSLRPQWFAPSSSVQGNASFWQETVRAIRAAAEGGSEVLEIRYEELVTAPEASLRRICAHIELEFHPAMLDYHRGTAARLQEHGGRVLGDGRVVTPTQRRSQQARTTTPPDRSRVDAWREELTDDEVTAIEAVAGDLLLELGYAGIPG